MFYWNLLLSWQDNDGNTIHISIDETKTGDQLLFLM